MSTADIRKAFAAGLQAAIPTATVYDAPQPSITNAPAIFVTIAKPPEPLDDGHSLKYTLAVTAFAYAGRIGERAADAEDEMDAMTGAVLAYVDNNKGATTYWQGAVVESVGNVTPAVIDGEDYSMCQIIVALTIGYGQLI